MVNLKARAAIESLYEGKCSVFIQGKTTDPDTKETLFIETELFNDQPCKLSFSTITTTNEVGHTAGVRQVTKLFIAPELNIPAGSKLVITQRGVTGEYSNSGISAFYSNHQEIPLELFEGWA